MKTKQLTLFLLFFSYFVFSQNLESIKELDTVYIFYKHGDFEKKKNITGRTGENIIITYLYQFFSSKGKYINFYSSNYKDFDYFEKGIKTDVKTVRKKFLKKNKDKIVDIDFFEENGFTQTFCVLSIPHKVIYLIDKNEIKGGKVKLKEVRMEASFTEE